MKTVTRSVLASVIFTLLFQSYSCRKDTLSEYDKAIVNIKTFDDDSIALPVAITAGNNCLLSAYNTLNKQLKFNLTDNEGNLIWQKDFGLNTISSILKESDGTFTIISGGRFINIDIQGNILKDALFQSIYPAFFDRSQIFHALINKRNNYVICGVGNTGNLGRNQAFAAEYTHNGDSVFFRYYIDTVMPPLAIPLGNYTVITGCEETDDGGYIFFGNSFGYFYQFSSSRIWFNIIRTNNTGDLIWQKNNLLVDSQYIPTPTLEPPFANQFPYNTDVYGFHPQSYTHEFLKTDDGNYLCFLNRPDYSSPDQRARIYKIDPDGNTLDSLFINFGRYNRFVGGLANYYKLSSAKKSYTPGSAVVKNADHTFSICMQNGFFGSKGLTNSYIGDSRSFVVRIDQDLHILNTHFLQNYYSDCFTSSCKSSDGKTVYFGLISSFGKSYKPAFLFSNDN